MNLSDTVYGDGAVGTERKVLPDGTTQLYSFSRAFDALGRVNSGPRLTSAHWDALGRPLDTASGLGSFGFGFEAKSGRLAQVDATLTGATAVMRTGLAYQGAGTLRRLTSITHQTGADTNSLGALSHHDYGYDGLGRLASWQKWIGAVQASAWTTILYDEDDQLKEVDDTASPAVAFGYGYDLGGNRTAASRIPVTGGGVSRTWSANGLNQLTAQTAGPESGAQFAYDDDGNLLGDGARSYEWDAENRLVAVTYNNNGDRVAWSYDAFHRRVKQTDTTAAGVVVHDLVWDGLTLIENRASQSGTPGEVRRYYGNGEERLPAGGGVTRLYYTTDHPGSIRELVDATGAVRARYDYDPYGARSKLVGDLDGDFGFTGHYTHAASGLVLAPFRGYDPGTGRWLSRDPIAERGGMNLYGYVGDNPINVIDPLGLIDIPVPGSGIWQTPSASDAAHVHEYNGVDQGPHMHGPNGQKFFQETGMLRNKKGEWAKAPKQFLKKINKSHKCITGRSLLGALGLATMLLGENASGEAFDSVVREIKQTIEAASSGDEGSKLMHAANAASMIEQMSREHFNATSLLADLVGK
jgi:RHS repeat-associated protein